MTTTEAISTLAAYSRLHNSSTSRPCIPGGGGGGGSAAGGGGAGGVIHKTNYPVTPGTAYTIVVGKGGAGGRLRDGDNGDNSTFSGPDSQAALTAYGGGRGLAIYGSYSSTGGSGGGKTINDTRSPLGYIPAGNSAVFDPQRGFAGGNAAGAPGYSGGGGGGAGGPGQDATLSPVCAGGAGGPGVQYDITGVMTWYAAGGGGASNFCAGGAAGLGGSGAGGAARPTVVNALAGRPDSGDGGGGSAADGQAGAGGSGIVVIRYLTHDG
jgi:hypothetical protein